MAKNWIILKQFLLGAKEYTRDNSDWEYIFSFSLVRTLWKAQFRNAINCKAWESRSIHLYHAPWEIQAWALSFYHHLPESFLKIKTVPHSSLN
jgi:hypothetical protein